MHRPLALLAQSGQDLRRCIPDVQQGRQHLGMIHGRTFKVLAARKHLLVELLSQVSLRGLESPFSRFALEERSGKSQGFQVLKQMVAAQVPFQMPIQEADLRFQTSGEPILQVLRNLPGLRHEQPDRNAS